MKLHLDAEVCQGHGRCYVTAPEFFASDDEGYAVLLVDDVPEDRREIARQAVASCPERAINTTE